MSTADSNCSADSHVFGVGAGAGATLIKNARRRHNSLHRLPTSISHAPCNDTVLFPTPRVIQLRSVLRQTDVNEIPIFHSLCRRHCGWAWHIPVLSNQANQAKPLSLALFLLLGHCTLDKKVPIQSRREAASLSEY